MRDAGRSSTCKSDIPGNSALLLDLGVPQPSLAHSTGLGTTFKDSEAQFAAAEEVSAHVPGPQDVSSRVNRVQTALLADPSAAAVEEEQKGGGAKRAEARALDVVPAGAQRDV